MIYCPNPICPDRQNDPTVSICQECGTSLSIHSGFQLTQPLKLSSAGAAEVFIANNLLATPQVMKILRVGDPILLQLFDRENQVLGSLDCPGIPRVGSDSYFSFLTATDAELKCLVMEKIPGIDLKIWLEQYHICLPDLARQWLAKLIDIVEYLHQHQLVHLDIKPNNIMLKPDGSLMLIDFGAVHQMNTAVDVAAILTPGYAPPEQVNCHAVPQSDFYAIGRTFVHLVTGQHPLDFAVDIHGHLQWRDRLSAYFPQAFADLIDRLMAPEIANRPANIAAIHQEIQQIEQHQFRLKCVRYLSTIMITLPLLFCRGSQQILNSGSISPYITYGEKTFIPQVLTPEKKKGMEAFANREYTKAIELFKASLRRKRKDPETQIFLHNARIGARDSRTIAVNVFGKSKIDPKTKIPNWSKSIQVVAKMLPGAEDMNDAAIKIALVREDDIDVAQQAAIDLLKQPDILGVVGPNFRRAELAVDDVYCGELVNIALIGRSLGSQQTQCPGFAFRLVPNEQVQTKSLSYYMLHKIHYHNAAIFFDSTNLQSQSVKAEFQSSLEQNGGRVVAEFDISEDNFKAESSIQKAIGKQAELLVVIPTSAILREKHIDNKLFNVLKANAGRLPILGAGSSAFHTNFLKITKASGGQGNGIFVVAPCCQHINDGRWQNVLIQDAVRTFMAAIEQQSSRAGIQQVIANPNFRSNGESGQIRFLPSGDRDAKPKLMQVLPGNRSGIGYDFVPLPDG
jgi:eukaryotic-like serine/threonine-protein kinase